MRSPKDMEIIQIDITNACINRCSNCTRFCGHHEKTFFMDFSTFKSAVDSLEGYPGMVGIIGGEPTIHPQFEQFCEYIRKVTGNDPKLSRRPIHSMVNHMFRNMNNLKNNFGLWTSLGQKFYEHFEIINDTFPYQLLNDHNNSCQHQALLMSRKELRIPDDEWIVKRDACWIQNTWSASITPKGAFFCEVAASFDMLFNGPGGWKIEKGWWKRETKDFSDQLHWCELCSAALDVPKRASSDEVDDVTPLLLEKLREVNSPKVKKKQYALLDPATYDQSKYRGFHGSDEYMDTSRQERTSKSNRTMYPKKFDICTSDNLVDFIRTNKPSDWIIVGKNENGAKKLSKALHDLIINPGCLYKYKGMIIFNVMARSLRDAVQNIDHITELPLEKLYPNDKTVLIKYIDFHPKSYKLYEKMVRGISHLSVFLIPSSKMRRSIRKKFEDKFLG